MGFFSHILNCSELRLKQTFVIKFKIDSHLLYIYLTVVELVWFKNQLGLNQNQF